MIAMLARYWWVLALRGVFAVIFGVLAIVWPELTLRALVLLFGAYALVDGIFAVIAGIARHQRSERWWAQLLEGVAGIIIGIVTFFWPRATALALLYLIAAWELVTGILEIAAAIQLRRIIRGEWVLLLSGIASIIFGLVLFVFPGAGALSLVWLIGVYSIVFGILLIFLAFRLRGMRDRINTASAARA